ncbi:hypothetical protein E1B28_012765 [Marasmius oreades]|uniref:Uncharacterized protein n=1 Tax=Marasmius oreades TaxID=181124 RepID=A0A9P7UR48_9AGAR|nr:uncharacterized protein E1B28_012765 [Marasmius oreades]KAG7088804.1 hypothetical protein E1B28_012765 [Marasmius oreades]
MQPISCMDPVTKRKNASSSVGHRSKRAKIVHEVSSDENQSSNAQAPYQALTSDSLTAHDRERSLTAWNYIPAIPIPFLCIVVLRDPNTGTSTFPSVDETSFGNYVFPAHCTIPSPKGGDFLSVAQEIFHQLPMFPQRPPVAKMSILKASSSLHLNRTNLISRYHSSMSRYYLMMIKSFAPSFCRSLYVLPPPTSDTINIIVAYHPGMDLELFEPPPLEKPTSKSDKQDDGEDSDAARVEELYHSLRAALGIKLLNSSQGVVATRKLTTHGSSEDNQNDGSEYGTHDPEASS